MENLGLDLWARSSPALSCPALLSDQIQCLSHSLCLCQKCIREFGALKTGRAGRLLVRSEAQQVNVQEKEFDQHLAAFISLWPDIPSLSWAPKFISNYPQH